MACNNGGMKFVRLVASVLLLASFALPATQALERQPAGDYRARRVALGNALHGGVAILFAAQEPVLDFDPYRQDSDFFYLTGWSEPGAALMVIAPSGAQNDKEILFLPTRDLRREKYTGVKMDAATPGVQQATGFEVVERMTDLPSELNQLIASDRDLRA